VRIASASHAVIAGTLIALGIHSLFTGDFGAIWQPVPKDVPARETLIYLCAIVSVASGAGLLWPRFTALAARVLLAYLLLWVMFFRVPVIFRTPAVEVVWEGSGETAVLLAGAWVLYAGSSSDWDRKNLAFATGNTGLRIARTVYGLALIPLGLAHLVYMKQTAALVPDWLPGHPAWAAFTGCTYIAAAVAVLSGVSARVAAALAALQMGIFTLLVWLPILATNPKDPFQWSESVLSWSLTIAAWVVADSYRIRAGLAAR